MQFYKTLVAAGLAGALGLASAPAQAKDAVQVADAGFAIQLLLDGLGHDYDGRRHDARHDRRISPRKARRIVRRHGYHDVSRPDYHPRRGVYVMRAENRRGRDVRIVVSARDGRILDVDRLGRDRRGRDWDEPRRGRDHGRHDRRHRDDRNPGRTTYKRYNQSGDLIDPGGHSGNR